MDIKDLYLEMFKWRVLSNFPGVGLLGNPPEKEEPCMLRMVKFQNEKRPHATLFPGLSLVREVEGGF